MKALPQAGSSGRVPAPPEKRFLISQLVGDGTIGWRKYDPFDVVVVSAASPSIPSALVDQLGEGGRMLIPIGSRESQDLVLVRKDGFIVTEEMVKGECTFVPLLGRFAWKSETGS